MSRDNALAAWAVTPATPLPAGVPSYRLAFVLRARCAGDPTVIAGEAKGTLTFVLELEPWAGDCPARWPGDIKGVGLAITVVAPSGPKASCGVVRFQGASAALPAKAAALYTKLFSVAAKGVPNFPKGPTPAALPTKFASCTGPSDNFPVVTSQAILDTATNRDDFSFDDFRSYLADALHLAEGCPADAASFSTPSIGAAYNAFCSAAAGGGGARATSLRVCVQGAPGPADKYIVGRTAGCFPGDATLEKVDPETGARLGRVAMADVAVGDAVACLVPSGARAHTPDAGRRAASATSGPSSLFGRWSPPPERDDEQEYSPGVCRVFGYLDADEERSMQFVALHYADAAGRPARLLASPEHLVYVAPAATTFNGSCGPGKRAILGSLPPGGATKRADAVRTGDLLAVDAAAAGARAPGLVVARVERVSREVRRGTFAPILTDAGLPLVGGAAAFSWVQLFPGATPHPAQNLGEYYRHIRYVKDFEASLASGCTGANCPCLDAPKTPGRACMRLGTRLRDAPRGLGDYSRRSLEVLDRAMSQGRTQPRYGAGVRVGRFYESHPWLWALERALGLPPHAVGLLLTDLLLAAPPREPAMAAGDAQAAAAGPAAT